MGLIRCSNKLHALIDLLFDHWEGTQPNIKKTNLEEFENR